MSRTTLRDSPRPAAARNAGAAPAIRFTATLHRPASSDRAQAQAPVRAPGRAPGRATWSFLCLPSEASLKLPSRGMVSVSGTINGVALSATLEPDGKGGHWLKVPRSLREAAGAQPGDTVSLDIAPAARDPEPRVPPDLRRALSSAPPRVREAWGGVTPAARRDWIHWITSAKSAATRARRIDAACDMLAKGKRRPCCFDRSGMYSGSQACPTPMPEPPPRVTSRRTRTDRRG